METIFAMLVEKGYLTEENKLKALEDDDIKEFKPKKQAKKKKTTEEREGQYDPSKCNARLWNGGNGNLQCSRNHLEGECFCKSHLKEGGWWLGKMSEKRPEKPINPTTEKVHEWCTDENGEPIKKEKSNGEESISDSGVLQTKKKRGRPKGSKNKKKKEKKDLTIEEIEALLEAKKEEDNKSKKAEDSENTEELSDEEKEVTYMVDGVPYEIKGEDILDPDDFSPIGTVDGKGGIIFRDEETEERHQENTKKYHQ
jgi:PAB1-binding protein PBP1